MRAKAATKNANAQVRLDDMIVGLADAQRLIGKGETHVLMLVKEGLLPKAGPARYRVADVAQAALKFRESEDRQSSLTEEAKRLQRAKAEEIELRTRKAALDLIPIDDLCDFLTETVGTFRSELAGVAAASTRDPEIRAVFETNLDGALDRIRRKFDAGKTAVRARRPLTEDDDAGDD